MIKETGKKKKLLLSTNVRLMIMITKIYGHVH